MSDIRHRKDGPLGCVMVLGVAVASALLVVLIWEVIPWLL